MSYLNKFGLLLFIATSSGVLQPGIIGAVYVTAAIIGATFFLWREK